MATYDAIVVGAGIVGSACAYALASAGLKVAVLDREAAASGTTAHGEGNILVSDKLPGPELDLALHSLTLWRRLAQELPELLGPAFPGIEYDDKGGLVVATTLAGASGLIDFAGAQRTAGVTAHPLDDAGARELEPWLASDLPGAMYYPQDAQVQPVIAAEALLAAARIHGTDVLVGTEVTGALVGRDGRVIGVQTPAGHISAHAVVLAAGPWTAEVAGAFGASVPVLPRRGMLLVTSRVPPRVFHKVYDADYVGAVESDDAGLQTSSVVESTASGTILIGSSRERVGFDTRLDAEVLAAIARRALRLFPFLAQIPVMRAYGGFRPYMPDHLPVIGPDPELPGLWHAVGHEGAGVGLAPATGALIADLVLGRTASIDAEPFRLDRPALVAARAERRAA